MRLNHKIHHHKKSSTQAPTSQITTAIERKKEERKKKREGSQHCDRHSTSSFGQPPNLLHSTGDISI
jgi:hypothetical protein